MRLSSGAAFAFATLLTPLAATAAEFVVVDAALAPYQSGEVLKGADKIALPAGAVVTLIGDSGTVTKLNGPVSGTLETLAGNAAAGADGAAVVASISKLLQSGTQGKALLTVRNVATPGMRTQPDAKIIASMVEVQKPGSYCVAEQVQPMAVRERVTEADTVRLTDVATGKVAILEYPPQVASVPWPGSLAVSDGASYATQAYSTGATQEITLYRLPASFPTEAHRIAWMVDKGCIEQARALLQSVAATAAGT